MAIVVEVAGTDRTEEWQRTAPTSWEDPLNGRGTGRIRFGDVVGGFTPSDGQAFEIIDGGVTAFAGILMEPQQLEPEKAGFLMFDCQLADYNILADRRIVGENYDEIALELIVSGIVTDHMDGEGISLAGVETGPALTSNNPNIPATQSFNALSDATGRAWYLDLDAVTGLTMNMHDRASISAPADLDGTMALLGTVRVREDRQKYRNEQIVKAGTAEFPIVAVSGNLTEQAARAAIEGTSGIYGNVADFPEILNPIIALEKAGDLLDRFAKITKVVELRTRTPGYRAGQSANVNFPNHGINNVTMLIDSVTAEVISVVDGAGSTQEIWYRIRAITGDPFGGWMEHFRKAPPVIGPLRFQNDPGLFKVDPTPGVVVHDPEPGFLEWFQAPESGTLDETPSAVGITHGGELTMVTIRRGGPANSEGCTGGLFPGCGGCFVNRQTIYERWTLDDNKVPSTSPTACSRWDEEVNSGSFKSTVVISPDSTKGAYIHVSAGSQRFVIFKIQDGTFLGACDTTMGNNAAPGEPVWTSDGYIYWPESVGPDIHVFDVTTPAMCSEAQVFTTSVATVTCVISNDAETFLYASGDTGNDLVSIDRSNPTAITEDTVLAPTRSFASIGIDEDDGLITGFVRSDASNVAWITVNVAGGTISINTQDTLALATGTMEGRGCIFEGDRAIVFSELDPTGGVNDLEAHIFNITDPTAVTLEESFAYNHGVTGNIGPAKSVEGLMLLYVFGFNTDAQVTFGEVQIVEIAPLSIDNPLRAGFGGVGIGQYFKGDLIYADRTLPDDDRFNGELTRLPIENLGDVLTVSGSLPNWLPFDELATFFGVGDGGGGDVGELLFTTNDFLVASGALQDLTELEATVSSGITYYFRAELFYDADASLGHRYAIAGTAAGNVIYQVRSLDDDTGDYSILVSGRKSALGESVGEVGAVRGYTEISGSIDVTADGTIVPQFGVF